MPPKQVDKSHYEFRSYMDKQRWASVWHQVDEIVSLAPEHVLEVGVGTGIFRSIIRGMGIEIDALDIDPELGPEHVGSVTSIPLPDRSYDVTCAFQVLEHLPYVDAMVGLRELARVASRAVVISLPDAKTLWRLEAHTPRLGVRSLLLPRPRLRPKPHIFTGEHYWEINSRESPLDAVMRDIESIGRVVHNYRVSENPYHRFISLDVR